MKDIPNGQPLRLDNGEAKEEEEAHALAVIPGQSVSRQPDDDRAWISLFGPNAKRYAPRPPTIASNEYFPESNGMTQPLLSNSNDRVPVLENGEQEESQPQQTDDGLLVAIAQGETAAEGTDEGSTQREEQLTRDMTVWEPYNHWRASYSDKPKWIKTFLVAVVGFLLLITAKVFFCGDTSEYSSRLVSVTNCIKELSGLDRSEMKPRTHYYRLALWFMGPGYDIPVDECTWGTSFADVYALLMVRDNVKVKTPTWYQNSDGDIAISDESYICQWKRVDCQGGRVTGLSLNNAELVGTLPTEIGLLVHLELLHLYDNKGIVGSLPTEVGQMTSLTSLRIQQTGILGTIPTELGKLRQLREGFFQNTSLTGTMPTQICDLPHISTLGASCRGPMAKIQCSCCTFCK